MQRHCMERQSSVLRLLQQQTRDAFDPVPITIHLNSEMSQRGIRIGGFWGALVLSNFFPGVLKSEDTSALVMISNTILTVQCYKPPPSSLHGTLQTPSLVGLRYYTKQLMTNWDAFAAKNPSQYNTLQYSKSMPINHNFLLLSAGNNLKANVSFRNKSMQFCFKA